MTTTLLKNGRGQALYDQWDHLGARHLAIAIATVHHNMTAGGEKPGAEKWVLISIYRSELVKRIVAAWSNVSEQDCGYFPFNEDSVCDRWIWYRKLDSESKAAWNDYLQLAF